MFQPPLQALRVKRHRLKRANVDAIEAADIHAHHLLAVRRGSAREGFDAARSAEQVMDLFLVKVITGELGLASTSKRTLPQ
jgi:hypothetical protein